MKLLVVIPIIIFVLLGEIYVVGAFDQNDSERTFQIPTSSTRTDHVDTQVLPNGCYPALALNGTYYEVCFER